MGYLAGHGQMAWDPSSDIALRGSHAPRVGAGESRAIGERHLREILSKYVDYYNGTRTHLSLSTVQLPSQGSVVKVPRVGGLHHEYRRRAA